MSDEPLKPLIDSDDIVVTIDNMWTELATTIREGIPTAYIDKGPEEAMRFALCAEACYWQGHGEFGDCANAMKIVAAYTAQPKDQSHDRT